MIVELDDEVALVRLAQSGSAEAFGVLVSRYDGQVYRSVRAIAANDDDAEKLLEATFLKACENLGTFNGKERFYAWLARIAVDAAVSRLSRHDAPTRELFSDYTENSSGGGMPGNLQEWEPDPRRSYDRAELNAILSRALEELELPLRIMFVLGDMDGFSVEETADILGLAVSVAETYRMRARLKLRDHLSAWFENLSVSASD